MDPKEKQLRIKNKPTEKKTDNTAAEHLPE
jgi:hypothetical protein